MGGERAGLGEDGKIRLRKYQFGPLQSLIGDPPWGHRSIGKIATQQNMRQAGNISNG